MSSEKTKPRRRFATIGVRLTLWGTGTALVVCLVLCGVLYLGMYYSLIREVDGFLHAEVDELSAKVTEHPGDYLAAQRAIRRELGTRSRRDLSFRLFDAGGRVLVTSNPDDRFASRLLLTTEGNRPPTQPHYQTIQIPGEPSRFRTCSEPMQGRNGTALIAQACYSLEGVDHSLALLRRICGAALVVATLFALFAGWFLAKRSLRPVDTMTVTAKQIGANRLTDRLPRSGTGDELDRLAETLNDMLARIEDHVRQIRQFTADASHEFRSPLAALRGMAEVALTKPRSADELREVIEASIDQYDRLQRLAEDLLLLAQADGDRAKLRREPVRLEDVIRDAAELYGPLAEEAGLTLEVHPLPNVELLGDGGRLRQMVGNLIDNAIKYSHASGKIEMTLGCQDGTADITVRDAGVGIAAEDLPHVFDRFYRGDKARASNGAGLGLAICQWIAQAHGGKVALTSAQGQGTTAKVRLPVSLTPAA